MSDDELATRLKNWDFVGRCYDVLHVDPLNIPAAGFTYHMAIQFADFDNVADGSASKPTLTDHVPVPGGTYAQSVAEITSAFDFQTYFRGEASLNVSDPTGALYSASLSGSFQQTQKLVGSRSSIVTYVSQLVTMYRLRVRLDDPALALPPELLKAIGALPTSAGADYGDFIKQFGTHFAAEVLFGGSAHQRISVTKTAYEQFLEQGVDLKADVTATFDIAKAGGSVSTQDKRSQAFTSSTGVTAETIVYSGGKYTQQMFDQWAMTVPDEPSAIAANMQPLTNLMTPALCPAVADLDSRRQHFTDGINQYLTEHGHDPMTDVLPPQVPLSLTLVASGRPRYLSNAAGSYARTIPSPDPSQPANVADALWCLVPVDAAASKTGLSRGEAVMVQTPDAAKRLDAQLGRDSTYSTGDGLAGVAAATQQGPEVEWVLATASAVDRDDILDGDYVRLQSRWQGPDNQYGYLLGEADGHDPNQRVYAFGGQSQIGTVWQLHRASTPPPHST